MSTLAASVDFAIKTPKKNVQGFLHGLGTNAPMNESFSQLRPKHWRTKAGSTGSYSRLRAYDPKLLISVNCSDLFGYANSGTPYNGNGNPWTGAGLTAWKSNISTLVAYHAGNNDVIWDIWNEPDLSTSFSGTTTQYCDVFKAAHDIIRTTYPNAIISGPCCANYNATFHTAFLDYCLANNVTVDAFVYHDFQDADPSLIATHVATIKALVAASYPTVGIKYYGVTEHTRDTSWMAPGDCLNYLYYLQSAGVDFGSRACWPNLALVNSCFDASLTNLINSTYPVNTPRAPWWAYKWYADIQRSQVLCTSADSYLAVMAGCSPAKVLLGFGNSSTPTVDVTLTIKNPEVLGIGSSTLTATVYKIMATGESDYPTPTYVSTNTVTMTNHSGTLTVPGINAHELYEVVLTA